MIALKRLIQGAVILSVSSLSMAEPIDLMAAYHLAVNHDSEIHAAYNQLMASKEVKPQALAALLPTIDISASTADVRKESDSNAGKSTSQSRAESFEVSLRQPLFNWASFVRFNQADQSVSRAEIEYRIAEQDLILRVTQQYLEVLQAEIDLTVANDDMKAFALKLDQAKQRFEVGLIAITDVHDAQARYDLSFATQIAGQDTLASREEALRESIQADEIDLVPLLPKFPLVSPEPNDMAEWEASSKNHNLSIKVAKLDVSIAKNEIKINQAGYYPTIDLVASHRYDETGVTSLGSESDELGVEMNLSLFAGGETLSLSRQAAFGHKRALNKLQSLQRSTLRETRDNFRGVNASIQRIQALEQAIISNKSSLEASEASLEVGTRTIVDVLDAQGNLSRAKLQLVAEKKNYILSVLTLKAAAGSLSRRDVALVNDWMRLP